MSRLNNKRSISQLAAQIKRTARLSLYKPYSWQMRFHEAERENSEVMLRAANRVGKTFCAGNAVAFHLTGMYPNWWPGHVYRGDVLAWLGSPTNLTSRDIVQAELLGGMGDLLGTGAIPKGRLKGKPKTKQAGIGGVADYFEVKRTSGGADLSGGYARGVFKSYDQGWRTWQGAKPDLVWLDEEPSKGASPTDEDYRIYTEAQTRVLTTKGRILVTFTPLYGYTRLVEHYDKGIEGTVVLNATWDDAPHLGESEKTSLLARYPDHERDARSKGIPLLGSGRIFPIAEDEIKFDIGSLPDIPSHWAQIAGCDFGIDHPAAGAWIAWDRDADIIYVVDCYKKSGETAPYHAVMLTRRGAWIPIAWPHDGMNREKQGGLQLHQAYRNAGATNMLSKSARYPRSRGIEKGGAQPQEPIIEEIYDRMRTGRFKVAAHLNEWFEEFRSYHRKDGRIVPVRDDILKATFYAVMMKRYASPAYQRSAVYGMGRSEPIMSTRI